MKENNKLMAIVQIESKTDCVEFSVPPTLIMIWLLSLQPPLQACPDYIKL